MGNYRLLGVLAAVTYVHFGRSVHTPSSVATLHRSCQDILHQDDTKSGRCGCEDLKQAGNTVSGLYNITLMTGRQALVHCDMVTEGGGWTMLLRRRGGYLDFSRDWNDYKDGFGSEDVDFWLGNDLIHELTSLNQLQYKLRVELMFQNGDNSRIANYYNFSVADEASKYKLSVDEYSGNAGDGLAYHNGMEFTTKDQDNDLSSTNCAVNFTGGWWYKNCHCAHLTGLNKRAGPGYGQGIGWKPWLGHYNFMDYAYMKFRPI